MSRGAIAFAAALSGGNDAVAQLAQSRFRCTSPLTHDASLLTHAISHPRPSLSAPATTFAAEQRLSNGSLWTRRVGPAGTALETETVVLSDANVLLTTVTFAALDPAAVLELQLVRFNFYRMFV